MFLPLSRSVPNQKKGRQKGFVLIYIILVAVGVVGSVGLTNDVLSYLEEDKDRRVSNSFKQLRAAKTSLVNYMLLRASNPFNIAQGASASIEPRLLMLLCPDNIGDHFLDGTQDPSCGAAPLSGINVVRNVLDSGSRFGRLPWSLGIGFAALENNQGNLYDGLGVDFQDAWGNRLWYSVARNMAPNGSSSSQEFNPTPLNFHRLATRDEGWLSVVNTSGEVIRDRVVAVVLSPGADSARRPESFLSTASLNYSTDVIGMSNAFLAPSLFFDSFLAANGNTYSNGNRDGIFVDIPSYLQVTVEGRRFNDVIDYIDLFHLMRPDFYFFQSYRQIVGLSAIQNAPRRDSVLSHIRDGIESYYHLMEFYPLPANQTVQAHLNTRRRHCALSHSSETAITATLHSGGMLFLPQAITVYASSVSSLGATVTVSNASAFLLAEKMVVSGLATVVINDESVLQSRYTLSRYARITLENVPLLAFDATSIGANAYRLSAQASVRLLLDSVLTLAPYSPLALSGPQSGWLGQHNTRTAFAATVGGRDGNNYTLLAATHASFLLPTSFTVATLSNTISVGTNALLGLEAGAVLRLEKDFSDLSDLDFIVNVAQPSAQLLEGVRPTEASYQQRQFAVWLLADAIGSTNTIFAPALIFPWRDGNVSMRNNLHRYPPCFDSREFGDKMITFLEDQTLFYAVSENCHYGAEGRCGIDNGLTVQIDIGVQIALPEVISLTQSYTATLNNGMLLTMSNGVVQIGSDLSLSAGVSLPLWSTEGSVAWADLSSLTLTVGESLLLTTGTALEALMTLEFDSVRALFIYSPSPLLRVACSSGMTNTYTVGTTLTLANQFQAAENINNACYWLDVEENADGDALYVIPSQNKTALNNDYFILAGGRLRGF